jgi:hypothetical protein
MWLGEGRICPLIAPRLEIKGQNVAILWHAHQLSSGVGVRIRGNYDGVNPLNRQNPGA